MGAGDQDELVALGGLDAASRAELVQDAGLTLTR
jgi:hypothetical protein